MSDNDNNPEDDLGAPPPGGAPSKSDDHASEPSESAKTVRPPPLVGPAKWEKGGPSPNPFGRPRKLQRMLTELQRHQDILRSLSKPVDVGGKQVPFDILNLELIKKKLDQWSRSKSALP